MSERLKRSRISVLLLAVPLALALPGDARGEPWGPDREKGVGGSAADTLQPPSSIARPTRGETERTTEVVASGVPKTPLKELGATIVIEARDKPASPAGRGGPLVPLKDTEFPEQPRQTSGGRIETSEIESPSSTDPIRQAQFAPGAAARPETMPPRRGSDAPWSGERGDQALNSLILPSPRKPSPENGGLQQALLTPNTAASPKEPLLRTAPAPDNQLVELVETPTDYALALSPGQGRLLNFGKAVRDVFVADPNIADVNVFSPNQISVHGNKLGRTNIFGIDERGDVVLAVDVDVAPDARAAAQKLDAAAPAADTAVSLRSGALVAEGELADVGEALQVAGVTEELDQTAGPTINGTTLSNAQQVNIRVRFAEVSRTDVFTLGINWNVLADTGDFLFGLSTGSFLSSGSDSAAGEQFGQIDAFGDLGDVSIDAFIDALQREGLVNLLAEPNLTSVNGEPANFLAGGEVPILVPGGGGDNVTIEYKPFGVSLDFIPTLLPGERINLRVRPEVSSISQAGAVELDGFSVPAFTVRRAETTIELASGQTFAIAGLFQRDLATDSDEFPVLGDVPVLGQLFRSQRFQRAETELVILITPYLVKPTGDRNVALPNDRLDDPAGSAAEIRDRARAGFIVD